MTKYKFKNFLVIMTVADILMKLTWIGLLQIQSVPKYLQLNTCTRILLCTISTNFYFIIFQDLYWLKTVIYGWQWDKFMIKSDFFVLKMIKSWDSWTEKESSSHLRTEEESSPHFTTSGYGTGPYFWQPVEG